MIGSRESRRARRRLGFLASLCWLALGASAAAKPDGFNVLLIVVDTLRSDRIGCYGYGRDASPAIDRLAAQGTRFDRAYSPSSWTQPSIASMLTGKYPSSHSLTRINQSLPHSVTTLAEILKEHGYATSGVVSHRLVTSRFQFDQGYESYHESEARGHDHISTAGVTREAVE